MDDFIMGASSSLSASQISEYMLKTFKDLVVVKAWGETSFFYNPDQQSPRGSYFCTLKENDGENDKASALHRRDIFRFNFCLSKPTFLGLFGTCPKRPPKGKFIEGPYDFTKLDVLTPHPIYGWMSWVAILNPSEQSFRQLERWILDSYELVLQKYRKKTFKF